jgi:uncharacterized tellurite resistance protein B-like protein
MSETEPFIKGDEKGCLRRVLVAIMVADDDIDEDEVAMIARVYKEVTGDAIAPDDLRAEGEQMKADGVTLTNCLAGLSGGLDADGRRRVFGAAFAVASADGFILEEEDVTLANVAAALGYSHAEYQNELDRLMGN